MYSVEKREYCELRIGNNVFVVFLEAFVLSLRIAGLWPSFEAGISWMPGRSALPYNENDGFQRAVEIGDLFQSIS
jgi:hypothetical protein